MSARSVVVERRGRLSGDGGAVLVEAGLVLPILLFLLMGMVDFAFVAFRQSQVSSAARDGARTGIIDYRTADVSGSTANLAIEAAVRKNLAGTKITGIAVRCITASATPATVTCANADANDDLLEVQVSWDYEPMTPAGALIGSRTFTSVSRMVLVGSPTAFTGPPPPPPPPPVVATLSVSPDPVAPGGGITVSGTGFTAGATVDLTVGSTGLGLPPVAIGSVTVASDGTFSLAYLIPDTTLEGDYQFAASVGGSSVASAGATVQVPPPPPPCTVSSVSTSPTPKKKSNGRLQQDFSFSVATNGSPTCTGLSIYYVYGNGTGRSGLLSGIASPYTLVVPASGPGSTAGWTTGTKLVQVSKDGVIIYSGTYTVT